MITLKPNQTRYVIELLSDGEIWTCEFCPFINHVYDEFYRCSADMPNQEYVTLDNKPEWCPLKKVE